MDKADYDNMVESIICIYNKVVCAVCDHVLEMTDKVWDDSSNTATIYVEPCAHCLESFKQQSSQEGEWYEEEEEIIP